MNDKIVTHGDLDAARALVEAANRHGTEASRELARSILAAAEADQPPLPEGWVLYTTADGVQTVYWHQGDRLYTYRTMPLEPHDGRRVAPIRNHLTPLRPAVTEADVEKAAMVLYEVDCIEDGWPEWASEAAKTHCRKTARAAFEAAEIEVSH